MHACDNGSSQILVSVCINNTLGHNSVIMNE